MIFILNNVYRSSKNELIQRNSSIVVFCFLFVFDIWIGIPNISESMKTTISRKTIETIFEQFGIVFQISIYLIVEKWMPITGLENNKIKTKIETNLELSMDVL